MLCFQAQYKHNAGNPGLFTASIKRIPSKHRLIKTFTLGGIPENKSPKKLVFQSIKCRKKQRLESGCSLGKEQNQRQGKLQPYPKEYPPEEARRPQTSTMRSQTITPGQAFEKNRSSDIATREVVANQTDSPEPRVQKWFLNQSDQHPEQSKRKSINSLGESPSGGQDLTLQCHQTDLSTLPGSSPHFLSPNFLSKKPTCVTVLPSHVSFVPWHLVGVSGSQGPCIMKAQPMQAAQGGEQSDSSPTPSLGRDMSDIQMPFSPQYQGQCQDHNEHSSWEVLQLKESSQPHPEHEKAELHDIAHILRWWDEGRLALIAEWKPPEGTQEQTGDSEADLWPHQLRSHLIRLANHTSDM
ncbi:double homeobox protein B isoform X2 [Dasypus novemcinctus]|uniref:double homeobox protein B isoform X2 n=1 Tax=Dasypus novemcinctus TaxID=9361 RepID=UPI00265DC8C9|nr:double homeobox protein B isoform X2 [Dasypus novemcinctus]